MSTIQNCKIVFIPKIVDPRGNLSVIENDVIPFKIKRVYYLYDVPSGAERGGHSHKEQQEFLLQNGCHTAQGYLFAKPMDAESFASFLHQN